MSQPKNVSGFEIRFPLAYANWLLSKAEKNYGIADLEGLAVLWDIIHSKTYKHDMHFAVINDHLALKALKKKSILTGRLLIRAKILLECYFDVIFCS